VLAEGKPPNVPFAELIRGHGGTTLVATLGAVACFAVYYIATAFALGYGTKTLGYGMQQFLGVQLGAILFMAVGIYLSAWLADRHFGERKVLMAGCAGVVLAGFVMAPLMGSGSLGEVFVFLALLLFLMGFVYGPLGGWIPTLFPARVRYTGASIAFNVAGVIGGGLTPLIAQSLALRGGLALVGLYLSGAALLSFAGLWSVRDRAGAEPLFLEP
jgi:MFS family permease